MGKSRRVTHAVSIERDKNAYKRMVGKPAGKRTLGGRSVVFGRWDGKAGLAHVT